MKKFKKMLALVLVAVMCMSMMSMVAFAAEPTYTITIQNAISGEAYTAYKLFEVTVSADKSAYSYYIRSTNVVLKNALEGIGLTFTASADGTQYLVNQTKSGDDVVFDCGKDSEGNAKTMTAAQLAAAINTQLNTTPNTNLKTAMGNGTSQNANDTTVIIDVSSSGAGYYFVDSSLGALCALDTVNGTAQVIYEKNTAPTIKKEVASDLNDNTYQGYGDGDVFDTINYKLTVNTGTKDNKITPDGTGVDANYVIEDVLPIGITVKDVKAESEENSKYVTITTPGATEGKTTAWDKGTDYNETWDATSRKLTITLLSTGKLANLAQNANITITYTAEMDSSAVKIDTNGTTEGNKNNVTLKYQKQTSTDKAVVYTYQIGGIANGQPVIQKIDGATAEAQTPTALNGVKFVLSKNVGTDESPNIKYATVQNDILTGWVDDQNGATKIDTKEVTIGEGETANTVNGVLTVKGLDQGTYILTEVATLPGYNLLNDTITVTITPTVSTDNNGDVTSSSVAITYKMTKDTAVATTNISIENNKGTELPSTGGIGTTIFYVIGAILVIGAGIILVTRKRMGNAK